MKTRAFRLEWARNATFTRLATMLGRHRPVRPESVARDPADPRGPRG